QGKLGGAARVGGVVKRGQARAGGRAQRQHVVLRGGQVAQGGADLVRAPGARRRVGGRRLERVGQALQGGEHVAHRRRFDAEAVAGGGGAADLELHAAGGDGGAFGIAAGGQFVAVAVEHAPGVGGGELDPQRLPGP